LIELSTSENASNPQPRPAAQSSLPEDFGLDRVDETTH
jgi:hypothetical protein